MRLGGTQTIKVDVRILAATNTDIEDLIAQKAFRKDLFYRLNVIKIEIPPCARGRRTFPCWSSTSSRSSAGRNRKEVEGVSEDVLEILDAHDCRATSGSSRTSSSGPSSCPGQGHHPRLAPPFLLHAGGADDRSALDTEESLGPEGGGPRPSRRRSSWPRSRRPRAWQNKAAKLLGVKPTTLNEMIKRLDIDTSGFPG